MAPSMAMPSRNILGALIALSLLLVGPGIASFIAGCKMYKEPENNQNWALLVLTASIVGFFGMGFFGIGAVLAVIGRVIGIVSRRR
jgi:hypothetical protein